MNKNINLSTISLPLQIITKRAYDKFSFLKKKQINETTLLTSYNIQLRSLIEYYTEEMKNQTNQPLDYAPFDYNELVVPIESAKNIEEEPQPCDNIVFIDQPNLKVFCKECRKEINKTTSILSNGVYRCVVCFAKAPQNEELFHVIKNLNFPLIDSGWKAIHEILFLNFLQKYGIGNWKEIKDQMDFYGAKHKEEELQSHYFNCYLSSEDYLPKFLNNDSFFQKRGEQISTSKPNSTNPTSIASLTTHQNEQYEQIDCFYANQLQFPNREINFLQCYNQKRNQFQIQYDQDAQFLLANLQFREDDTEEQTKIKFKLIQEYNKRLDRRNNVKHFILQHRLLEENYQKEMDKQRTDLEKEAFEELKSIARFTNLNQYTHLVRKVAFTKQLKLTIQGLRKFRRTHPSNFKNLDEFLSSQPEQSKPRKRAHNQNSIKTGKKMDQMLQKHFKLSKKDFQTLLSNLAANGKKAVHKNVQAVLLESNYDN